MILREDDDQITGRDDEVWLKALAYAIVTVQALPPNRQEPDFIDDMTKLLYSHVPDQEGREYLLRLALMHITGFGGPEAPNGTAA